MSIYRVDIDYIDFDVLISDYKKVDLEPIEKNLTQEFIDRLHKDGFVNYVSGSNLLINMDVAISDVGCDKDGFAKSLSFTEAMNVQRALRKEVREETLEEILK